MILDFPAEIIFNIISFSHLYDLISIKKTNSALNCIVSSFIKLKSNFTSALYIFCAQQSDLMISIDVRPNYPQKYLFCHHKDSNIPIIFRKQTICDSSHCHAKFDKKQNILIFKYHYLDGTGAINKSIFSFVNNQLKKCHHMVNKRYNIEYSHQSVAFNSNKPKGAKFLYLNHPHDFLYDLIFTFHNVSVRFCNRHNPFRVIQCYQIQDTASVVAITRCKVFDCCLIFVQVNLKQKKLMTLRYFISHERLMCGIQHLQLMNNYIIGQSSISLNTFKEIEDGNSIIQKIKINLR